MKKGYVVPVNIDIFNDKEVTLERCGLIVDRDGVHHIIEVPNRHSEPESNFRIFKSDVRVAMTNETGKFVGIIHTHPLGSMKKPSEKDVESIPTDLFGIVYHPSSTYVHWYSSEGIEYYTKLKGK